MILRRVVGLMTAAFMLHLNVAANDTACAKHAAGSGHATDSTAMAGMDMPPMAATHAAATPHAEEPAHQCETPVVPSCCQAMVSCSSVYVGNSTSTRASRPGRADFDRARVQMLISRLVAPEPPPPRA